jgi:hypothetical protein
MIRSLLRGHRWRSEAAVGFKFLAQDTYSLNGTVTFR